MRRWLWVIGLLLAPLCASCGAFEPDVSQALSRFEVRTEIVPSRIIRDNSGGKYQIRIIDNQINTNEIGSYPITFEITQGRRTAEVTYYVSIVDTTKPVLEQISPYVIQTGTIFGDVFNVMDHFRATDNYDGDITANIRYYGSVDTSRPGMQEIEVYITDSCSNTTVMTVTIQIEGKPAEDELPPEEPGEQTTYKTYTGSAGSTLTLYTDSTFTFRIYTCEGYAVRSGSFESTDTEIILYLNDFPMLDDAPASRVLYFMKDGNDLIYISEYVTCSPAINERYQSN